MMLKGIWRSGEYLDSSPSRQGNRSSRPDTVVLPGVHTSSVGTCLGRPPNDICETLESRSTKYYHPRRFQAKSVVACQFCCKIAVISSAMNRLAVTEITASYYIGSAEGHEYPDLQNLELITGIITCILDWGTGPSHEFPCKTLTREEQE